MKTDTSIKKKTTRPPPKITQKPFTFVAIGASVGGLEAVSLLLKNLPADTGMAFIYVQHLNPDHKSLLANILSKLTKMPVQDIDNMAHILPNNVYIIPTNKMIEVTDGHIKLLERPKNSSIISIDVLFSSLAETHKENVIGIVLSGNAHDGTVGLKDIKEAGGITFAQDDSAQAGSMPQSAIAAGVVDYVLSPYDIALELAYLSKNNFVKRPNEAPETIDIIDTHNADLNTIFELLRKETGVDFSHYKIPTIKRRISHKMSQNKVKSIPEYVQVLRQNNHEIELLYNDLLINVTSFFRDAETFDYLKTTLFPKILKSKTADETLRIWIPACSTGEEAYSIAMIINELQDKKTKKIPVQIFATDLSEQAIKEARIGEYAPNEVKSSVPEKYLNRYFTKTGDKYRIVKELRENCLFAPHNILRDPPFSRMDFVSCCNLLIYFDSAAQKKVFATVHFALNEGGYLMLGKAETVGTASILFTQVTNKFKIYAHKKNTGVKRIIELLPRSTRTIMTHKKPYATTKHISAHSVGIETAIDAVLLADYMPACAVVNKDMEIVQFRGPVSLYLEHASGKASLNILKMAKPEFAFELRYAIVEATKTKETVHKSGIDITIDGILQVLSFEVSPLKIDSDEPLLLVVFKVQAPIEKFVDNNKSGKDSATLKDQRIKKLTQELNTLRLELNALNESHEITYEELQAANEEIVSSNEEYQTLNEELETSKEEIEVTNEELISTNHELQIRNDLLTEAQEYSDAITATIHEPMLILDKNGYVKSANKSFYSKFLVKKEETEGQLVFDLGNKQWDIPALRTALNIIFTENKSLENFEVSHTFSGIGEKIMLLNARLIVQKVNAEQLLLLAIEDVTDRFRYKEHLELTLKEISDYKIALDASSIVDIVDNKGIMRYVNDNFCKISQYTAEELIGQHYSILMTGFHAEAFMQNLIDTISAGQIWRDEISKKAKDGSIYWVLTTIVPFLNARRKPYQYVSIRTDITKQKRIEKELNEAKTFAEEAQKKAEDATQIAENATQAKQQFLSNMSHEIRTPMNAMLGFTKVVLKTDLSAKQKEYLTAIKMSGDSLIVLINDILDLAKVDAGKMSFEQKPFKLAASIVSILHLFEPKIQEKNLTLISQYDNKIPKVLLGDAVRLHQIILNLLSNAVKFTTKGTITVSVKMLRETEDAVNLEFAISDTGIGIRADKIDTIFDNFQQAATDTTRLFGGTGLGLAIVKQLVHAKGGTIQVESKVNEGSTFSFKINLRKTDEEPELLTEIEALDTENKSIKVLVVEDMALNQLLMKTILDDFGFDRDIADNGKIAIEKLKTKSYDIVLMDLQMPEMNGFEATEYIRNTLKSKIPIIALTADVTTVDVAKCKAVGMNDYIAKPVDERLLYSKIVGLVKKPAFIKALKISETGQIKKIKCTNMDYLHQRTKNNTSLIMDIIAAYLEQTPPLISAMKQSFHNRDWTTLNAAVHKMIPSFSIMGINAKFEIMARKVSEYAQLQQEGDTILEAVKQLENVCLQACEELKEEFNSLKNRT
jgi:two-component system, chemotaxis family, CheB/CheR fusion protein